MKLSRSRRGGAALVAVSALLLSACGQNAPGVAADVAGAEISDQEVDEFARVLCALNVSPTDPESSGNPTRPVRLQALALLLDIEMARKIADLDEADQAAVQQAVEQSQSARESVPANLRDVFDEKVEEYAVAQLALTALGERSLAEQGQPGAAEDVAFSEGEKLRLEYAKTADIRIDPRFGTLQDGILTPGSGSLSVPVSDFSVQAISQSPSEAFRSALPASQTCTG